MFRKGLSVVLGLVLAAVVFIGVSSSAFAGVGTGTIKSPPACIRVTSSLQPSGFITVSVMTTRSPACTASLTVAHLAVHWQTYRYAGNGAWTLCSAASSNGWFFSPVLASSLVRIGQIYNIRNPFPKCGFGWYGVMADGAAFVTPPAPAAAAIGRWIVVPRVWSGSEYFSQSQPAAAAAAAGPSSSAASAAATGNQAAAAAAAASKPPVNSRPVIVAAPPLPAR